MKTEPEPTEFFTEYVELLTLSRRDRKALEWLEHECTILYYIIKSFKALRRSVFGKYQTTGMGTQEWHLLDYLGNALRETGGLAFLHSALYEDFYKILKNLNRKSSKRCVSVKRNEALGRHSQNLAKQHISENKTVTLEPIKTCKAFPVKNDCRMMVAS